MAKTKTKLYLIDIMAGVDAKLNGPFTTGMDRARTARGISRMLPQNTLVWMDIDEHGVPALGTYTNDFKEII